MIIKIMQASKISENQKDHMIEFAKCIDEHRTHLTKWSLYYWNGEVLIVHNLIK